MKQKSIQRLLSVLCLMVMLLSLTPAQAAYSTLRPGTKGGSVTAMQQALHKLGYTLKADGTYGPATARMVRAFQSRNSLKVDGIAGNQTLTRLYSGNALAYAPDPTAHDTSAKVATQRNRILYLRSTPSSRSKDNIIALMPTGASIGILEKGGTWSKVTYSGKTGYAMTAFLQFASTVLPPAPKLTPGDTTKAVVTTQPGRSLNLRSSQDNTTKKNIIAYIPSNAVVDLLSRGPTWCQVRYNGKTGYVMSGFLRFP